MAGMSGELAGHRGLHEPAGDDEAVDLVGALEDAVDAGVAVGALGGVLLDVAVAGEDLDGLVDDAVEHLGGPDLDDGALDGVVLDRLLNGGGVVSCRRWQGRASMRPTVR